MFQRLGHLVFRLRFAIIVAWIAAAAGCAAFAPSLADVGSADQSSFLPPGAESVTASDILDRAFPSEAGAGSATIAFSRPSGLTDADRAAIGSFAGWLTDSAPQELRSLVKGVVDAESHPEVASRLRSADGVVELVQLELAITSFDPKAKDVTTILRDHLATGLPAGLTANVTGSIGIGSDYLGAILQATDRTTVVTIVLVILVLLLIYRAPLAAAVPLATIAAAFLVSRGVLGYLGQAGWKISSLLETFVVVLVFGVGTDYTIFLISRFREEVGGVTWRAAVGATVRRIGAVITASAATVALGLGSMAAGQFGMFQTTGPALAITILVTLGAGLTLAPALLGVFGHHLFWPLKESSLRRDPERGLFGRLARLISRRPIVVALVVLVALGTPAIAAMRVSQSFDVLADLPPGSDAKAGFAVVADHFDKGQLLPIVVVIDAGPGGELGNPASLAQLHSTTAALLAVPGVKRAESLVSPSGDGTTPDGFRPSVQLLAMSKQFAVSGDAAAGLQKLLDPATTTALRSAGEYVGAVARAYPDLATTPGFTSAAADLALLPDQIGRLRAAMAGGGLDPLLAQQVGATNRRLSTELGSLSATFGGRPDDYFIPTGLSGPSQASIDATRAAYLSADGTVTRLYAVSADDPYSAGAFATVGRIREALGNQAAQFGPTATLAVGGQTALQRDLQDTIDADFLRVAVLTVLGVLVVLALLLRSLVAPLYLVGTVLLSYVCTLGIGALVFQDILGQSGMNYFLPLMVFVLLVALGSDYNIFLMSRVREESEARGTSDGIRAASARTGAVITSAGVILAGTFLAMVASPLTVLFQVGIMVAVGVLIDTFVVRSLLVPAITTILGDAAWWPFRRRGAPPAPTPRPVAHPQSGSG